MRRLLLGCVFAILCHVSASAQEKVTPPKTPAVAATVNGQSIPEQAVQRGLRRVPAEKRDEARAEILHFLIDNALVDQYLVGLKISVDKKDIDARIQIIKDETKKEGK